MNPQSLSKLASSLISVFEKNESPKQDKKISVNAVVSKVASFYERIRNSMEYREEEVVLRASIERILKRRFLLGGTGKTMAEPLVRELLWARYFDDNILPESVFEKVEKKIEIHLLFRKKLITQKILSEKDINSWVFNLMSSDLEQMLSLNKEKNVLVNFMFQIIKNNVSITDDSEETKDAQVYIAVRRSFAKEDIVFLRFYLFKQIFGELNEESIDKISSSFKAGFEEIQKQLNYPLKDRIYSFIKSKTAVFFVLEDLFRIKRGNIKEFLLDEDEFKKEVIKICEVRYKGISSKIRNAIIKSVLFILLTKAIIALTIEGTYDNVVYGGIVWSSMLINIGLPPMLMLLLGLFIKTPDKKNTQRILSFLKNILEEENPSMGEPLILKRKAKAKASPMFLGVFTILWFLAFLLSFGSIGYVLTRLHFNIVSQGIFLFFIAIVSFLSYRIWLKSRIYSVGSTQGLITPLADFFFMPLVRVGRHLTEGISQFNFFLFAFDIIIEIPFKGLFGFFEQWFFFLHSKREELD